MSFFPFFQKKKMPVRTVVIYKVNPLPDSFRRFTDVLCKSFFHPLPVKMRFTKFTISKTGHPTAQYDCPFPGCHGRMVFTRDENTGKRRILWSGQARHK